MLRDVLILCFFTLAQLTHSKEGHCHDLQCASKEELLSQISILKTTISERNAADADSNCTACYSNPCLNGGTCYPVLPNSYRCDCPDYTSGANCQTNITCKADSCGKNAQCYVQNHQINCVCNLGYSGNPVRGCTQQSKKICFNGDPHYTTFDGAYYDYQSTCPYVFSMPCTNLTGGYSYYSVKAKNELQRPGDTVSFVESTQVEMYGQTIYVDSTLRVFINDIQVHIPYYYPSKDYTQFSITLRNRYVVIQNDQFVEVDFTSGELCLMVPDVAAFQGVNTLCGLAGNLDNSCKDDFILQNGTQLTLSSCRPAQSLTDTFGDSWRTNNYTQSNPPAACVDGKIMTNSSGTCDVDSAAADCQAIYNAQLGTGPFAGCIGLGNDTIQQAYDSCLYDVCRDEDLKCPSLVDFVHLCQWSIPNVDVSTWRDDSQSYCPITCPANSEYSSCVTACPATCAQHDAPAECYQPCAEGCACDYGYVVDTTQPATFTCIPVQSCGCTDDQGNFHPPDQHWLTNDCTQQNYCSNGTYYKGPNACQPNAHCGIQNNEYQCICDSGYQYNPDTNACDDVNECLDPTVCSADQGHGTCTNTPGSYYCTCAQYYTGDNCQTYGPMRHCADLYVYHGATDDGVYTVYPPTANVNGAIQVYCNMQDGGGWMLMANALTNETANRTMSEYVTGFGDVTQKDAWMGLSLIQLYTNYQPTSLRVNIFRCATNGVDAKWTDCTYPSFTVDGEDQGWRVTIPQVCSGTEEEYYDGWARWTLSEPGPVFTAFDNDNSTAHCSQTFRNTGFWFDTSYRCGSANLNGVRFTCDNIPTGADVETYLFWGGSPVNEAELYLRPFGFPDYDSGRPSVH